MTTPFEIVDTHQHTGDITDALGFRGGIGKELSVQEDAERRVRAMDRYGVDWTVLQPCHAYEKADGILATMRVNDTIAEYRKVDPGKFRIIAGTVEPMHGLRSMEELERMKYELKLDAVSWHHRFQGCFMDCRWTYELLRKMSELQLMPIVHCVNESSVEAPWRLQRLARDFPELTFLAHDALWSWGTSMQIMDTAMQTPNVIWEFGGPTRVRVRQWVEQNGATNLCYSADLPYGAAHLVQEPHLRREIEAAPISDEDKANIFGGNIRRMFGMPAHD